MSDLKTTLDAIRKRVLAGERVPQEELAAAFAAARASNLAAAAEVKSKKQPARSADQLLELLEQSIMK